MTIPFQLNSSKGYYRADITIREAILAGWTGRDRAALVGFVEMSREDPVLHPGRVSGNRLPAFTEIQPVEFLVLFFNGH